MPLQVCTLVTMDIGGTGGSRVRSYYSATSVTDVALYTEPEEIYLMKKNGDVVLYDATNMTEVTVAFLSSSSSCPQFFCNINCILDDQNREHRGSRAGGRHVRHLRLSAVCQWKRADLCDAGLYFFLICILLRIALNFFRVRPRPPAGDTSTCTPTPGPGCTRSTWTCTSTASPGTSPFASTPTQHSSQLQTRNVSFYSTSRTATFSGLL